MKFLPLPIRSSALQLLIDKRKLHSEGELESEVSAQSSDEGSTKYEEESEDDDVVVVHPNDDPEEESPEPASPEPVVVTKRTPNSTGRRKLQIAESDAEDDEDEDEEPVRRTPISPEKRGKSLSRMMSEEWSHTLEFSVRLLFLVIRTLSSYDTILCRMQKLVVCFSMFCFRSLQEV